MTIVRKISLTHARRLALTKQRLTGPMPANDKEGIMGVARSIGCLQLDPTSAVARNHLLIVWSRVGNYDPKELDTLLWDERRLFEYWAHAASIVLTEDFPIYQRVMHQYPRGNSQWSIRVREWLEQNSEFRDYILGELRARGPMQLKEFPDRSSSGWTSSGWTDNRNPSRMLDFLWVHGLVMVTGRKGGQRLWDLAERVLPDWTPKEELSDREATYRAAQKSLRMLGVGTVEHIKQNYTRGCYPHIGEVISKLESEGLIERVEVVGDSEGSNLPGVWYIHAEDLPILERIEAGEWQPRTTLLSPFDNLIADRNRTERLFDYRFRIEIYVPKHLREYGYYVLSILHGDRIIGRIDPTMDRKAKRLTINAVYAEPDAPMTGEVGREIAGSIAELGEFLGAKEIVYGERVPEGWQAGLRVED